MAIQRLRELDSASVLFFEQCFTNVFSPSVMISPLTAHVRVNLKYLTLCMLGNFPYFSCQLLTFSKLTFSKKSFWNTIRASKGLDPDQNRHSAGPDLGRNCLQTL